MVIDLSAHPLIMFYICNNFHENIFYGFIVILWTRFSYENFQRGIFPPKI